MPSRDSDRPPPDKSRRKATPTRRRDEAADTSGRSSARHSPPRQSSSGRSTQEGSYRHHSAPARRSDNNSSSRRTSRRTPSPRHSRRDTSRRHASPSSSERRLADTSSTPRDHKPAASTDSRRAASRHSSNRTARAAHSEKRAEVKLKPKSTTASTSQSDASNIATALAATQIASTSTARDDTVSGGVRTPPHARADMRDFPLDMSDLDFVAAGQEAYEEAKERQEQDIVYQETPAFWIDTPPMRHSGNQSFAVDPRTDAFDHIPLGMSPKVIIPYEIKDWRQGGNPGQTEFQACIDLHSYHVEYVLTKGYYTHPLHTPLKLSWLINIRPRLEDDDLFMSEPRRRHIVRAFIYATRQMMADPSDDTRNNVKTFFRNLTSMNVIASVLFADRGQVLYNILSSALDATQADGIIDTLWEYFDELAQKDAAYYNVLLMALDLHTNLSRELQLHHTQDGITWSKTLADGKRRLRDIRMGQFDTIMKYMSNFNTQLARTRQKEFQDQSDFREGERQIKRHRMREPPSEAFTLPGHDNALCEHGVIHPPTPIVEPFDKYTVVKPASLLRAAAQRQPVNFFRDIPRYTLVIRGSTVVIAALTTRQKEFLEAIHLARPGLLKIPDEFTHIWVRDPDFVLPPIGTEKHALTYDEYVHDTELMKFCREVYTDPDNVDFESTLHPWNPETRRSKRPSQCIRELPQWCADTRFSQMSPAELTEADKRHWHALINPPNKKDHSWARYRDDPTVAYKCEDEFQHIQWLLATKTIPTFRVTSRPTQRPPGQDAKEVVMEYEPVRKWNRHYRFCDGILPDMVPYLRARSVGLDSVEEMEFTYKKLTADIEHRWDLLWILFYRNLNGNTDHVIQRAVRIFLGDKSTFKDPFRTPEQALEDFLRQPYYAKRDIETHKGDSNPKCSCLGDGSYFHCPEVCHVLSDFSTFLSIAKATGICPGTSDNTGQICSRSRVWEFGKSIPTPHQIDACSLTKKHGRCTFCGAPDHQLPWCRFFRTQIGTYDMDEDDMVPPLHILVNWNRALFPRNGLQMFTNAITSGEPVQIDVDTFFQDPNPEQTPAAAAAPSNIHALAFDLALKFATSSSTGRKRPSQENLQIEHKRQKDDRPRTSFATPSKEKTPRPTLKERDHPKDSRRPDDKKFSAARSRHRSTDRK